MPNSRRTMKRFHQGSSPNTHLRTARLSLAPEPLELRAMLSGNTFTPTVFTDDNTGTGGSLRDAILAANADPGTATDTIVLGSGTYSLTIPNVGDPRKTPR